MKTMLETLWQECVETREKVAMEFDRLKDEKVMLRKVKKNLKDFSSILLIRDVPVPFIWN